MAPPVSSNNHGNNNGQRCPSLSPPGRNLGKLKLGGSEGMEDSLCCMEDSTRCLLSPLHAPDSSKTSSKKQSFGGGGSRLPSLSPPRERGGGGVGENDYYQNTFLDESQKCLLSPLHEGKGGRPSTIQQQQGNRRETRGGGSRGRRGGGPRVVAMEQKPDRFSSTEVVYGSSGQQPLERQASTVAVVLGEPIMPRNKSNSKERLDVLGECSSHSSGGGASRSSSHGGSSHSRSGYAPTRMTSDAAIVIGSSKYGGGIDGVSSPSKSSSSSPPKDCTSCGYENIPDGAKFCPGCGSNLMPETVCSGCGYDPIPDGAKFCPGCGSSTTANAAGSNKKKNDPLGSSSHSHSSQEDLFFPKNRPRRLANKKRSGSNEGLYAMKERLMGSSSDHHHRSSKDASSRSADSHDRLEKLMSGNNNNRMKESSNSTNTNIAPEKLGKIIPSDQAYNDIIIDNWDFEDFDYTKHFELENDRKTATANDPSSSSNNKSSSKKHSSSSNNSVVSFVQITNRYKLYYRGQRIYEISSTSGICDEDGKRVGQACTCVLQGSTLKIKRSNLSSNEGVPLVVESFVLSLDDLVRKAAYARQDQMLRNNEENNGRGGGGGGTPTKSSSGSRGSHHHHNDDYYDSYRSGGSSSHHNHRSGSGSGHGGSNSSGSGGSSSIYIRLINKHMNVDLEKRRSRDEKPASMETFVEYGRRHEYLANIIFKDQNLKQIIKFPSDLVQYRKDKAKEIYLEVKKSSDTTIGSSTIKWDYQQLKKYTLQNLLDAVDWRKGRKINIHIGIG